MQMVDSNLIQSQTHKIVLLGDKASGKTCLARRWAFNENLNENASASESKITIGGTNSEIASAATSEASIPGGFSVAYKTTVGLDIYEKTVIINYDPEKSRKSNLFPDKQKNGGNELHVKIQVWDVSGDLIHDEYLLGYILYGCSAVLFCYDISSFLMFQDLAQIWYPAVMRLYVPLIPPGRIKSLSGTGSAKSGAAGNVAGTSSSGAGNSNTRSNANLSKRFAGSTVSLAGGNMSSSMASIFNSGGGNNNTVVGNVQASFASLAPSNVNVMKSNVALGGLKGDPESNEANRTGASKTNTNIRLSTTKPYFALIGTKNDLSYSRAVKLETHHRYAYEQNMYTYFVSAKTGEKVHNCFYHVACDLAGVVPKTFTSREAGTEETKISRPAKNTMQTDKSVADPKESPIRNEGCLLQ